MANVARQSDLTASDSPYVIGSPMEALPASSGRYGDVYRAVLQHRGAWLPVTFRTASAARAFTNAAAQMRAAMNKPDATGPVGLERLEVKMRKLTVYVRVPDHVWVTRDGASSLASTSRVCR